MGKRHEDDRAIVISPNSSVSSHKFDNENLSLQLKVNLQRRIMISVCFKPWIFSQFSICLLGSVDRFGQQEK